MKDLRCEHNIIVKAKNKKCNKKVAVDMNEGAFIIESSSFVPSTNIDMLIEVHCRFCKHLSFIYTLK